MKKLNLGKIFILLLAAAIWGAAFVAQRVGADYVGPLTFLALRSWLGGLTLLPLVWMRRDKLTKGSLIAGIIVGLWLFIASYAQQAGIPYTTTAKAGFITALYVVFVPIISFIVFHRKISVRIWLCVALSVVGLFLLNHMTFFFSTGDIMVLLCAVLYAGHILTIDHYSRYDGIIISCIQFFTAAIIATIGMLVVEDVNLEAIRQASLSILYAGILSSGVGYTLQIVGQKGVNPAIASICLSMESAFAAISGFLILNQRLSLTELIGCALMFASVIISQLPSQKRKKQA